MSDQCEAYVYHRDQYRVSGDHLKFRMHYTRERCKRKAKKDGLCTQHGKCFYVERMKK